ncbi:MAG: hypothetical protein FWD47_02430 [Treponema sp.]|nr:hypothetical protein [Treponema sp.]
MKQIFIIFLSILLIGCGGYVEFQKIERDYKQEKYIFSKDFSEEYKEYIIFVLDAFNEDYYLKNEVLYISRELWNDKERLWNYCNKATPIWVEDHKKIRRGEDTAHSRLLRNGLTNEEINGLFDEIIKENINPRRRETKYFSDSLPFELTIIEDTDLKINKNGTFEFGNNIFSFMDVSEDHPFSDDIGLFIYHKNNLLGICISIQYLSGGSVGYVHVININTKEDITFEKYPDVLNRLREFFYIDNIFITAFDERAYAFDDYTGELLWTQRYNLKDGKRVIMYDDHFIIDDEDGYKYKIYGDGRKEIM